jgi:hypothetical protein
VTIAEQVILALNGDFVPFAVNVAATDVSETVRPFMGLAEQLGRILSCLNDGLPDTLEIEYQGGTGRAGTGILTLSVLKGLFAAATEEPVSYVNAPQLAAERGLEVRETSTVTAHDYVNLVTLRSGDHAVAGTLTGPRTEPRLVMMDDHVVEVPPAPHMVVVRNDDRAGMIGVVGTILGEAQVSISSMAVGHRQHGADGPEVGHRQHVHTALIWCSRHRPPMTGADPQVPVGAEGDGSWRLAQDQPSHPSDHLIHTISPNTGRSLVDRVRPLGGDQRRRAATHT